MEASVVVGQIPISWHIEKNVAAIAAVIDECRPNEIVVLPEGAISGYDDDLSMLIDVDVDGIRHAVEWLSEQTRRKAIHLFCGSLLHEHGTWWNAAIHFDPGGRRRTYRKVNLATHERGRLASGDELPTIQMHLANGILTAGVQICRDLLFPEQWQYLADAGSEAFIYLTHAANPSQLPGIWRSHLVSRAAANQRFVIAANVADLRQHCPSLIASPRGEVIAELPAGETAVVRAAIDTDDVSNWYLDQRRTDLLHLHYRGANDRPSDLPEIHGRSTS